MEDRVLVAALIGHEETIVKKFLKIFPRTRLYVFDSEVAKQHERVEYLPKPKSEKEFLKFFSEYDRLLILFPGADFNQNCILRFIDYAYVESPYMRLVDPRGRGKLFPKKKEKQLFKSLFMKNEGRPEGRFRIVSADIDGKWEVGPTIRAGTGHDGIRIYKQTRFGVPGDTLHIKTEKHLFSIQLHNGRLIHDVFIKP
jgi:hypothetical protein